MEGVEVSVAKSLSEQHKLLFDEYFKETTNTQQFPKSLYDFLKHKRYWLRDIWKIKRDNKEQKILGQENLLKNAQNSRHYQLKIGEEVVGQCSFDNFSELESVP